MPRAARVATIGFAGMIVFQAALAAGARLGAAAWGGAHAQLTTGQRLGSAVSVLFYAAAIVIVRRRAAGHAQRPYRWGAWGLALIFALAAVTNLASESQWEKFLMAPVALVLAALCAIVARTPTGHRGRASEGPPAATSASRDGRYDLA
jgi:hypothetical protein